MSSRFALLFKLLTLAGLILVMLIPMAMIMGVIEDRSYYQQEVINSVAKSSSYAQTVAGPIIVVPYIETVAEYRDKQKYYVNYKRLHYILPQTLDVKANADVSARHIGIYQAQVYQSDIQVSGEFNKVSLDNLKDVNVEILQPYMVILISDTRGIIQVPTLKLDNELIQFEPGINDSGVYNGEGIHALLPVDKIAEDKFKFNFSLQLQGTKELSVVPLGRSSNYALSGNWPHPNFVGYTLPVNRDINDEGFSAEWQSSWYANNINSLFMKDINITRSESLCSYSTDCFPKFKTSFVETVDQYQMTERAVKYDILFIVLTFVCFFIFEMLKQLRIHPVQYLLVGMALTVFYLLLLALSEHIGFLLAYIIGAVACSLLIGFYLSAVLRGIKWGGIFSLFLLILYTILYFVMISEGNALVLGSIILFIVLAGIMVLTRKIDWYKVTNINTMNQETKK